MTSDAHPTTEASTPTVADVEFADHGLAPAELAAMVGSHGECVFNWSTREGYPVGVVVAYAYREGTFWTNCVGHKKRVAALRARPQSAVVLNKDGRSATFKGTSRVHAPGDADWDALRTWFYPAVSGLDPNTRDPMAAAVLRFLDSPHQVIIETPVNLVVSFEYAKFAASMQAAISGE